LEKLLPYKGKKVNIGIKDRFDTNKVFFYAGKLADVDLSDNTITVETKSGVVFLDKDTILQISLLNLWEEM